MRLLLPDDRARARYAELVRQCPAATVYHTLEWLDLWTGFGADLVFVELDAETMVPFVCRGRGMLRRAYSLPFDTYGGPVTARSGDVATFEHTLEPLGSPTARVVDFSARVTSINGAARPRTTHIVNLADGYPAARARYTDANQRLIRQAGENRLDIVPVRTAHELAAFHDMHGRTVARYGARPLPHAFFQAVFERLVPAGLASFHLARRGDTVVAGNLVLRHAERAFDWMWVYDDRFLGLRATNLLIDHAIRDEAARGSRELNLGTSPNERLGSVRFKQAFGAVPFTYTVYAHTSPVVAAARAVHERVTRVGARVRVAAGR